MENLKIRVNSKAESKEAQGLLEKLGFKKFVWGTYSDYFIFANSNYYSRDNISNFSECDYKEITLPELRDLVVLKRNDVGDANAFRHDNGVKYYITSDNKYYYFSNIPTFQWTESCNDIDYLEKRVKPIEKPMKEYLRKNSNGTYSYIGTVRPEHVSDFMIEIPEGCNIITCENRKGNLVYFHWKSLDSDEFFLKDEKIWSNNFNETLSDFIEKNEGDVKIIWSRHTQPEELPFIDDEPSLGNSKIGRRAITVKIPVESLNDQYAEIEKVRQSAWQKQEGGSHYKNLKIQPMQYALENKLDYAQANVVKYVTRHKEKNGKEDLLKAIHNLELMIEFYYGDEK